MIRRIFILGMAVSVSLVSLLLLQTRLEAAAGPQTAEVGGTLTEDTVWTAVNSPYVLTSTLFIPDGITLTVEPGVTVLGQSYGGIIVQGEIVAIGTAVSPITFTSVTDSAPGEWPGLLFWDGVGHFEHVAIRYGGEVVLDPINGWPQSGANINVPYVPPNLNNSNLILRDVQIQGSSGFGIFLPTNLFNQSELTNVTFTENITNRVQLITSVSFPITTNVTLSPQPGLDGYEFEGGLIMDAGTLTLEPGVTLFCASDAGIVMQNGGHLTAVGTPQNPITFTTVTDTAVNRWGGIFFWDGSAELVHTRIRFAGADVGQQAVSALHVYEVPDGQAAVLENSTIEGSGGYAIAVEVDNLHQLHLQNNQFINNAQNRILLLPDIDGGDGTLAGSANLPGQSGLESYDLLAPGLVVPTGMTLTVGAGAAVMSANGVGLRVDGGHLAVLGTQTAPVQFTSAADNGPGEWAGLQLVNGTAVFDHAELRFGVDNLVVSNTAVSLQNSQIHDASNNGIYVASSGTPALTISDSAIFNNGGAGLQNDNVVQVDARNVWWGSQTGPAGDGTGSGDAVWGNVLFVPWLEAWDVAPSYELYLPTVIIP